MDHAYQKFKADLDKLSWVVDATYSPPLIDLCSKPFWHRAQIKKRRIENACKC